MPSIGAKRNHLCAPQSYLASNSTQERRVICFGCSIEWSTQKENGADDSPWTPQRLHARVARALDAAIIDPFVSCHAVPENDNGAIDLVLKAGWGAVADRTGAAVELVHPCP
jgi:hypothetical protein